MDATVQAELLQQLPDVDPDFLREHRDGLLASLGAVPGVDAVRAAVVRLLPELVPDPVEREPWLQAAARALRAYPDGLAAGDPMGMMSRHPAWVGLCHLELADALSGDGDAALAVAIEHARLGFEAATRGRVGEGEVLWAMAEAAEEAGWSSRSDALLERAAGASFSDPVARDQVGLLFGTRWATEDPGRARPALDRVAGGDAPHPLRVQASFVLSRIAEAAGEISSARDWLSRGLTWVDPDDDPRVGDALRAEIRRLDTLGR